MRRNGEKFNQESKGGIQVDARTEGKRSPRKENTGVSGKKKINTFYKKKRKSS